ncbi:MAG: glycoside hydrolase family 28 protein [Bacteroidota bacterium]|nr:glycoside hydrolase family 28 protein [Bacteroidota bacterium]
MKKRMLPVLCLLLLYVGVNGQKDGLYSVRDFGAKGDGIHLDSRAINLAIQAAAKAGGGKIIIPAGTYLCGSIHLESRITLELAEGALLIGAPPGLKAYDPAEKFPFPQYQDGGHTFFHNSLIWGVDLQDVSIVGHGRINGGGLTARDKDYSAPPDGGSIGTADKIIALKLCKRVLIEGITIYHGGHFAILVTGCDQVTLDHLLIDTNRDGIDIDGCSNTVVNNCDVNSPNDDAICPKSSFALNRNQVTQNLVITNCRVSAYKEGTLLDGTCVPQKKGWSGGRIKFGTESNGGFRNCVVSNCIFRSCDGLALEEVDGGLMENIVVDNLTMEDVRDYPIYITVGTRNRGPRDSTQIGQIRNVFISNVIATGVDSLSGIQITGTRESKVENIHLRDIFLSFKGGGSQSAGEKVFPELGNHYPEPVLLGENPAYGIFIRHARDIYLDDIVLKTQKPDYRPVMIGNDVEGLTIQGFKFNPVPGVEPVMLRDVHHLSVSLSPMLDRLDSTELRP